MQRFGKLVPPTWPEQNDATMRTSQLSSDDTSNSPPRILATRLEAILNPEQPHNSHSNVWHIRHKEWRHCDLDTLADALPVNSLSPIPCTGGLFDDKAINSQNIWIVDAKLGEFVAPCDAALMECKGHIPFEEEDMDELQSDSPCTGSYDFEHVVHMNYPPTRRILQSSKLPSDRVARGKRGPALERERLRTIPILDSPLSSMSPIDEVPPPTSAYGLSSRYSSLNDDRHIPRSQSNHSTPRRGIPVHIPPSTAASSSSDSGTTTTGAMLSSSATASGSNTNANGTSNIIVCEFDGCGQSINVQDTPLGVHLNDKHRPRNQDRNSNVTCLWDDCRQSVKWRNLRRHIMEYHLALLFKECPVCEKTFSRSDALKRHERLYCPGRRKAVRGAKTKAKLPYKPLTWRTTVDWRAGPRKAGSAGLMMEDEEDEEELEEAASMSE